MAKVTNTLTVQASLVRALLLGSPEFSKQLKQAFHTALTEAGEKYAGAEPARMQAVVYAGGTKIVAPLDAIQFVVSVNTKD